MFRFTIRDVLWLTVVVALGCGWWLHVRYFENRERERTMLRDRAEFELRKFYDDQQEAQIRAATITP